jgi:RNA polymerase sigma-70 factor (ECF subfamily)
VVEVKTCKAELAVERDESLARRAATGSRAAFYELYERYAPRIYALALRMLGDSHLAHDLTQDVFARAWAAIRSFDPDRKVAQWLIKIASNRVLDELKQRRRWTTLEEDDRIPDEAPRPESVVLHREELGRIREALVRVPEGLRLVLVLIFQEQLTSEEVSDALGISANLVRVRLFRGLRRLQGELSP